MTKYIGYIRVSTEEQGRSGLGLEAQHQAIQKHADGALVETYQDIMSGSRATRPGLLRAIEHAKRIDGVVLVLRVDRLGRRLLDLLELVERSGATFKDTEGRMDMTTPTGRAMFQMCGVFAELEREFIRQRMRDVWAALPEEDEQRHPGRRMKAKAAEHYEELRPRVEELLAAQPGASDRELGRQIGINHKKVGRLRRYLHQVDQGVVGSP